MYQDKEKNVTTKLSFIDRLMGLSHQLINGNSSALNRPRSYDVVVLPSPTRRGSQQSPLSSVPASTPGVKFVAMQASGRADRVWAASRQTGLDVEHTHSNMG